MFQNVFFHLERKNHVKFQNREKFTNVTMTTPNKKKKKEFALLPSQFLDIYSSTFDKPYFERRPLAWNITSKQLIRVPFTSCKMYWFNVCVVVMAMNGTLLSVLLWRQYRYGSNSTWIVSFFPVVTTLILAAFLLTVMFAYWSSGVADLVGKMIALERRLMTGNFGLANI